jgi:nucleoside-diphosphate-sugar epimerase
MKVVIGGNGFVGARLCNLLKSKDFDYAVIDKEPAEPDQKAFFQADVRDLNALKEVISSGDIIINLSAEHRDDVRPRSLYDEVNVQGARHICQVASEKSIKQIVFTSSVAVYGFAAPNTGEDGKINPFNDYGRTKAEAEDVYRSWQAEDPEFRSLIIVRPTVIFGEQNRGNVYNLLTQIQSGRFVMIGNGRNRKSMAYVENVAAFLLDSLKFGPGVHTYNYIDKPDFDMNTLVSTVREKLGKGNGVGIRLPYSLGLSIGYCFDLLSKLTRRSFPISSIRVKKFCATTQFSSSDTGFKTPVSLEEGLSRTVQHEFLEDHSGEKQYYSE